MFNINNSSQEWINLADEMVLVSRLERLSLVEVEFESDSSGECEYDDGEDCVAPAVEVESVSDWEREDYDELDDCEEDDDDFLLRLLSMQSASASTACGWDLPEEPSCDDYTCRPVDRRGQLHPGVRYYHRTDPQWALRASCH